MDHPELLRLIPERWRNNRLALAALSGALSLLIASEGCASPRRGSHVAPIFTHGEGRASFGCVAINPPVFLSEAEARDVVLSETKQAGLDLSRTDLTIKTCVPVTVPGGCFSMSLSGLIQKLTGTNFQPGDLVLDGFDRNRKVGFEFVSGQDYTDWHATNVHCASTVRSVNIKAAAETLRADLSSQSRQHWIGVFYEPAARPPERLGWKEGRAARLKPGEEELRKQVRDFIAWLKVEGVI